MITITENIAIKSDLKSVFEFISNYENDTLWREEVQEMKQSTKGFTAKGTFTKEKIKIFGIKIINNAQVIKYEAQSFISFKVVKGLIGLQGYRCVREIKNHTVFEYSLTFDLPGVKNVSINLLREGLKNRVQNNLNNLKLILEGNSVVNI